MITANTLTLRELIGRARSPQPEHWGSHWSPGPPFLLLCYSSPCSTITKDIAIYLFLRATFYIVEIATINLFCPFAPKLYTIHMQLNKRPHVCNLNLPGHQCLIIGIHFFLLLLHLSPIFLTYLATNNPTYAFYLRMYIAHVHIRGFVLWRPRARVRHARRHARAAPAT